MVPNGVGGGFVAGYLEFGMIPADKKLFPLRVESLVGWRPSTPQDNDKFHKLLNVKKEDSLNVITENLEKAARSINYTTKASRRRETIHEEPDWVVQARVDKWNAKQNTNAEEKRLAARALSSALSVWDSMRSKAIFNKQCLALPRDDKKKLNADPPSLKNDLGQIFEAREDWPKAIKDFVDGRFGNRSLDAAVAHLQDLEKKLDAKRQVGQDLLTLPFTVALEARGKLNDGKQGGRTGVVAEVIKNLSLEESRIIVDKFQDRIQALPDSRSKIDTWAVQLMIYIPKLENAGNMKDWRPLTLLETMFKWYSSCVAALLRKPIICHTIQPTDSEANGWQ